MGNMAAFRGTGGDDAENEIWRELGHDFFLGIFDMYLMVL